MGTCEPFTDDHLLLAKQMVNLTLRLPLLAAALRDLTLVFPEPTVSFRLPGLLAFTIPCGWWVNSCEFPRLAFRKCISKNLTLFPTVCSLLLRRTVSNKLAGSEIRIRGSVPHHPEIPSGYPDLRRTFPRSFPDLFAIGSPNLPKESIEIIPKESPNRGAGLIFSDELCPYSKNLIQDSQHSESSPKPLSSKSENFCSLRNLSSTSRERLASPFISKPTCQRTP